MKYKPILAIVVIMFLSSCNLFVSSPTTRANETDPNRQINAFTAVPSGDASIVTMWYWKNPQDWIEDYERIEEIKIIHSTLGYQEFNVPFVGKTFTDSSVWQYEWKDLKPDTTHYFSLFVKNQYGNWFPSYKEKITLPGVLTPNVFYSRISSVNVDNTGIEDSLPDNVLEIGSLKWAVLFFDIPDTVFVKNASITISTGPFTDIVFAPLDNYLNGDGTDKWDALSNDTIVRVSDEAVFSSNLGTFDITNVVRAAAIGPENAILIKTTDTSSFSIDNNASAPFITADILK